MECRCAAEILLEKEEEAEEAEEAAEVEVEAAEEVEEGDRLCLLSIPLTRMQPPTAPKAAPPAVVAAAGASAAAPADLRSACGVPRPSALHQDAAVRPLVPAARAAREECGRVFPLTTPTILEVRRQAECFAAAVAAGAAAAAGDTGAILTERPWIRAG